MMNRPRVLNMAETDLFPGIWGPLAGLAEVVTVPADAQVLADLLPDFDAYFATLHARLTADIIRQSPRLKVVATPSTGLDHLDLEAMAACGVALLSLVGMLGFVVPLTVVTLLVVLLKPAAARR